MKKVSALPVFRVVLPTVQFDDEFGRTRPDGGCELSFLHPSFARDYHEPCVPCSILSAEAAPESFGAARGFVSFERRAPPERSRVEIRVLAAERRNALSTRPPNLQAQEAGFGG